MTPLDYVNPLQGTDSRFDYSRGNTYPAVGVPRGMTYWTPQTDEGRFIFDRRSPKLAGIRATHSPSPWMGDFGHFDVTPVVGAIEPMLAARASSYRLDEDSAAPHRFSAWLVRDQIRFALTATDRCGLIRFEFPADVGEQAAIVIQVGAAEDGEASAVVVDADKGVIHGIARGHCGGAPTHFGCHFYAEVDGADIVEAGVLSDETVYRDRHAMQDGRAGAYVRLRPRGPVTLRIATSFIDEDQARRNFASEIAGRSFEEIAQGTADAWQRWLARLESPEGSDLARRKFYTALYRVGLFPMKMHEPDESGGLRHYSPYDDQVHTGVMYTNNGFWDTHRTVYPLLGVIDRDGFGEIIEGFLNAYRQGGWFPKWASPGYRDCMVSTHIDAVIAEAVVQGIEGFDYGEAYEAIRRNAFEPGDPIGRWGRLGLESYLKRGYVADEDAPYSVSRTLDFAYGDWCIAQVAARVGRNDDREQLLARSKNYRLLWDATTGFMRPRRADGTWVAPWSEFEWGGPYIEGGPWQHSWNVPHDVDGLAELAGGHDALADKLEAAFQTPPRFQIGHYRFEIHEMTEMALATDREGWHFGQYAHSNQPSHGMIWLLAALGRTNFAGAQLRRVMTDLYTPDNLPGDEDNGEMSAWYLLATLGRYRLCPGSDTWVHLDASNGAAGR